MGPGEHGNRTQGTGELHLGNQGTVRGDPGNRGPGPGELGNGTQGTGEQDPGNWGMGPGEPGNGTEEMGPGRGDLGKESNEYCLLMNYQIIKN